MTEDRHDDSLPLRGLHVLAPWAWRLLVLAVVTLAVYVAAGRFLMQRVPALHDSLEAQLNARLPFTVQVQSLAGGWRAFSPELRFRELLLTPREEGATPVAIDGGRLRLDVPGFRICAVFPLGD